MRGTPPAWITYSPLLPLALLMLSGLSMFFLPYLAKELVAGHEAQGDPG